MNPRFLIYYFLFIIFIILGLMFDDANASEKEIWIGYAPICRHLNIDGDVNEENHGIFLSYDDFVIGTFNNSNHIQSYLIAATLETKKFMIDEVFLKLNAHVGILYGYGEYLPNLEGWAPAAIPTFEIGYKQFSIETMYVPLAGGVTSWMFKYSF